MSLSPLFRFTVRRRRLLAISVRGLLALTLIVAVGLGWLVHGARVQRRAIARIERAGGNVIYDYPLSLSESSWVPGWLRSLEATSITYYAPGGAATPQTAVPLRTIRIPETTPRTLPVFGGPIYSARTLPRMDQIAGMTVGEIEWAKATCKTITRMMQHESQRPSVDRKPDPDWDLGDNDPRRAWARLVRRVSYESPWQPAWLQRLLGPEYFQAVHEVSFREEQLTDDSLAPVADLANLRAFFLFCGPKFTGAGLGHLRGLKRLETLGLEGICITEASLVHLTSMPRLKELLLFGVNTTDADLRPLASLTQLRALYLMCMRVTDAGLAHLESLTRLEKLTFLCDSITDAGLFHLRRLVELEELDLSNAEHLGDGGLVWLEGMKHLRKLNLSSTNVTDAGLIHLSRLPALQELKLSSARKITSAGLAHLSRLPALRRLNVENTCVDEKGVAAIQREIVGLTVSRR